MKIVEFYETPDSTYFKGSEVAPVIADNEIRLTSGWGTRRSTWGTPGVSNYILVNEEYFCAILTTFTNKYSGGQFYTYFIKFADGSISRYKWNQLSDGEKYTVYVAYQNFLVNNRWVKTPGTI